MSLAQGSWLQTAQPTTVDLYKLSFVDSVRGWVCGDRGVILRTTNGGVTWDALESGIDSPLRDIHMLTASLGWAIAWKEFQDTTSFYGTMVLRTTDGGDTWTNEEFPIAGKYFHTIRFVAPQIGWMGGEEGVLMRTIDGGESWSQAQVDSSLFMQFPILNLNFYSEQIGFGMGGALDFAGVIWQTTNGGERWTARGISPEPIYQLHFVDSLNIIGIVGDFDFGASMVRSTDGGREWEYTYLGIFGQPRTMSFRTPAEGWVPLGNQLMVTLDTANSWFIHDTLGSRRIYDLVFVDSTTGFAVADSGYVFRYVRGSSSVDWTGTGQPSVITLCQNFPNPFNPQTTVGFFIPETFRDPLSLRVYDVLGREVATLVEGLTGAGYREVTWETQGIASGLYYYRLRAGLVTLTKKMLLLK